MTDIPRETPPLSAAISHRMLPALGRGIQGHLFPHSTPNDPWHATSASIRRKAGRFECVRVCGCCDNLAAIADGGAALCFGGATATALALANGGASHILPWSPWAAFTKCVSMTRTLTHTRPGIQGTHIRVRCGLKFLRSFYFFTYVECISLGEEGAGSEGEGGGSWAFIFGI